MNTIVSRLYHHDLPRIPSRSTVVKILHDRFGLSHRAFNSVKLRQYQTKFAAKRLWLCRLLVQVLSDNFLVVSIDESSFSTRQTTRKKWMPTLSSELLLEERHRRLR